MYDYLVMFLKSRVMNGLSDRYDQLRINIEGEEKTNNWLESFLKKKYHKKIYLKLFILEEIIFHIEEKKNQIFYDGEKSLLLFFNEIKKISEYNKFISSN